MHHTDALIVEGGAAGKVDALIAIRGQVDRDDTVDANIIEESGRLYNEHFPGDEAVEAGDNEDGGADSVVQHEFAADKGGDADIGRHQSIEVAAMPGKEELAIVHDKDPCHE